MSTTSFTLHRLFIVETMSDDTAFLETVRLSIAFTVFQVMGSVASLLGYGPSYGARHSMSVGEPIYD